MNISIKATNTRLSDAIDEYIRKRLLSVEKLIDTDDTSARCEVEVELTTRHHKSGPIFRAEMNLHIAGHDFRAEATAEKLFDAVDEVKTEMVTELRKYKDKKIRETRRGGAKLKDMMHEGA